MEVLVNRFFYRGGLVFFKGFLKKSCRVTWCFCGEIVVKCVVEMVIWMAFSGGRKM
jgi:hypothetical protein